MDLGLAGAGDEELVPLRPNASERSQRLPDHFAISLKARQIKDSLIPTFHLLLNATHGMNGGAKETLMTNYPYILFNKSPEQLRRLGARGGRAYGCNQRARRARMPKLPDAVVLRAAPRESTAEAIAVLDAQFPWLRDAEKRVSCNQPSRSHIRCANSH